ncbi:MAG: hypothetical protein V4701_08115 [Pseudomonadota bacterium]
MTGFRLTTLLTVATSALVLAACGSAEVASPGEGDFGGGTPTTPTVPTLPAGTPAADCPTGLANVGLVANNTLRACQLPATITGALTLSVRAGTIYTFSGRTEVGTDRGVEPGSPIPGSVQGILTIDPGVKIFASGGSDYLIVNRGSQIFAEGTATNPIIFTSRQSVEGQNNDASQGQWGGVILVGRAPQANCVLSATPGATTCTGQVEGTSAFYGGNTPADNSGRFRYVQINFSGFAISTGNELQGLTLGAVGSGTTIDHIQVHNSADDGIEIFGGNVNLSHIVLTGADDDGLDTDTGWRGGAQFGIVTERTLHVKTSDGRGAGFEFSSAPAATPLASRYVSQAKIANWTLVTRSTTLDIHTTAHFDTGADATIINSVFSNAAPSASGCLDIADADTATVQPTFNAVFMSCSVPYRPNNAARSTATFAQAPSGGNTAAGTSTLTAPTGAALTGQALTFINGANENAVTPVSASSVYSFFVDTPYIGAVRNAADTWYLGWTCGLSSTSNCR